jgi:hypothetical protein
MKEMQSKSEKYKPGEICFGLDRETDERSLKMFLKKMVEEAVLDTILPRLADEEFAQIVDHINAILHAHLSKEEYHRLFLEED